MTLSMQKNVLMAALVAVVFLAGYCSFKVVQRLLGNRDLVARSVILASRFDAASELVDESQADSEKNGDSEKDIKPDVAKAALERISKRYLFSSPPPQQFRQVQGVLGDRVYFQGGSAGVGEQYAGATVKAVGSNWVELEFEGETMTIGVFGGQGARRSGRPENAADSESSPQDVRTRRNKSRDRKSGPSRAPQSETRPDATPEISVSPLPARSS